MDIGVRRHRAGRRLAALAVTATLLVPLVPATTVASGGLFHPYVAVPVGSYPEAVAIGDLTGDGLADVALVTSFHFDPANDYRLFVFPQTAEGALGTPASYPTASADGARPESVAIGDMDGDGRADAVVGLDRYGIQAFYGQPDGTLGDAVFVPGEDSTKVRIGVFDKSGRDQVAGIGWGTDTVTIYSDTGAGLVAGRTYDARHAGYDDLEVGDVTGDGLTDLVVMSGQAAVSVPNVSVLAGQVGGGFAAAAEYSIGTNTHGIGLGDVTGDGRADVVTSYGGNSPSAFLAVFPQAGDGTLGAAVSYPSYDIPEPVEVADVDGDGRLDAVTAHGGWNRAGVYRGLADGTLATEDRYPIPYASHYNPHGLAVGDLNSDGWPDLAIADYNNGLVLLYNTASPAPPSVPGAPTLTAAAAGDGEVALAWTAPADDGGSPITGYTASASPGGATCATTAALACTIGGLTNGTTYSFTVRATNEIGTGPASNTRTATPFRLPSTPTGLTTSPNLAEGVGLAWSPPASSGTGAVKGYAIYRGGTPGSATLLTRVNNVLAFIDRSATLGSTAYYQVAALNDYGEGPRSDAVIAVRGTAPSAPQGVSISATGQGITVRWTQPATDGGTPVTGYRLYRGTSSSGETPFASLAAGVTSYVDKAVTRKTRYYYVVTAVNVLGEGPASTEVSAQAK